MIGFVKANPVLCTLLLVVPSWSLVCFYYIVLGCVSEIAGLLVMTHVELEFLCVKGMLVCIAFTVLGN